jgi:hypothetical protein
MADQNWLATGSDDPPHLFQAGGPTFTGGESITPPSATDKPPNLSQQALKSTQNGVFPGAEIRPIRDPPGNEKDVSPLTLPPRTAMGWGCPATSARPSYKHKSCQNN